MILIDMDMPTSCEECPFGSKGNIAVGCKLSEYAWAYSWGKGKLSNCPLHEITDSDTISRPQWIPCSDRLPDEEVLCCDTRGEMIIGYPYQDEESSTGYGAVLDDVVMIDCIAWMPLPEPYHRP